jgi:hypothetical protein
LSFVRTFLEGLVCDSNYLDVIGVMKVWNVIVRIGNMKSSDHVNHL